MDWRIVGCHSDYAEVAIGMTSSVRKGIDYAGAAGTRAGNRPRDSGRGWHVCGLGASASALKSAGLAWVTFQVMLRTHSSLLRELDVAPEIRAQQIGHTVDVNENVYTETSLESRRQ